MNTSPCAGSTFNDFLNSRILEVKFLKLSLILQTDCTTKQKGRHFSNLESISPLGCSKSFLQLPNFINDLSSRLSSCPASSAAASRAQQTGISRDNQTQNHSLDLLNLDWKFIWTDHVEMYSQFSSKMNQWKLDFKLYQVLCQEDPSFNYLTLSDNPMSVPGTGEGD